MYFDYLSERLGYEHIQNECGFVVYQVVGKDCFIHELYVAPEYRRAAIATHLADNVQVIAKDAGCTRIWGQVIVSTKGATNALQAHLNWGLKLHSTESGCIITVKEI